MLIFQYQGNITKSSFHIQNCWKHEIKKLWIWKIHALIQVGHICSSNDLTVNFPVQTLQFFKEMSLLQTLSWLWLFIALEFCNNFCTLRSWIVRAYFRAYFLSSDIEHTNELYAPCQSSAIRGNHVERTCKVSGNGQFLYIYRRSATAREQPIPFTTALHCTALHWCLPHEKSVGFHIRRWF